MRWVGERMRLEEACSRSESEGREIDPEVCFCLAGLLIRRFKSR